MAEKSIFEFADKFGYESPLGNWMVDDFKKSDKIDLIDIFVTKIEGPSIVCEGTVFEYKVVKFSRSDFILGEIVDFIKWGYSVDGKNIISINQKGNGVVGKLEVILKFKIPKLHNSNFLKIFAWINKPNENVFTSSSILNYPFLFNKYKKAGLDQQALNIADDMCYGDGINKTEHFKYSTSEVESLGSLIKSDIKATDKNLWVNLTEMVGSLFTSIFFQDLRKTALSMFEKFKKNEGGVFSSQILTNEVIKHEKTIEFYKKLEVGIQTKVKNVKGNLPYLFDDYIYLNSSIYGRPFFNKGGDISTGLTIMLNDTWANEIFITDFTTSDSINYNIK